VAESAPRPAVERATIEHVALAAGVSVATVSRALRGLPNVAVATRLRVQEVARELNYRADPDVSRAASGRSHTVAVVVPMINSWYFSNVVAGAEAVCAESGYDLLVVSATTTATRRDVVATVEALHRRVDGIIFAEVPLAAEDVEDLRHRRLGVVTIGQDTSIYPAVRIDNVHIGEVAVEHLVELGHRHLGILGAQAEDPTDFDVPARRIDGARAALAAVGVQLDPTLVASGEFTVDGGRQATLELLSRPDPPTAIFALSDEMAFGAVQAARELGVVVPRDLSLVGVDDHEVSQVLGLTTVRQRVAEHGAVAARALLRRLGGEQGSVEPTAPEPELVVRTSTRRYRAGVSRRAG
jgi:LacI family repressor for deo operon, udp, cdd, tsx, nupC, and nupG